MKRLIIGVVAAMAMVPLAMAQEQDTENLDVWKRNKGITLSYITNQSLKEVDSPIDYQYDRGTGIYRFRAQLNAHGDYSSPPFSVYSLRSLS